MIGKTANQRVGGRDGSNNENWKTHTYTHSHTYVRTVDILHGFHLSHPSISYVINIYTHAQKHAHTPLAEWLMKPVSSACPFEGLKQWVRRSVAESRVESLLSKLKLNRKICCFFPLPRDKEVCVSTVKQIAWIIRVFNDARYGRRIRNVTWQNPPMTPSVLLKL